MSTVKSILCLLAIVAAYGIAGRLDYEDAVMLEEIERRSAVVVADDCLQAEGDEAQALLRPHELRDPGRQLPLDPNRSGVPALARPCHDNNH
jgi:hypothetical protein